MASPSLQRFAEKDNKSLEEIEKKLAVSTTLYVGNLSFFTTEEQIYELFSKAGEIKRIIMGLNKYNKTPCGFCFVEFYTREDAQDCLKYINGTRLDDRNVKIDWDPGFEEKRQFGRGRSGGQVVDEYRTDYDPARGGFGKKKQLELAFERKRMYYSGYNPDTDVPVGGDFSAVPPKYPSSSKRQRHFEGNSLNKTLVNNNNNNNNVTNSDSSQKYQKTEEGKQEKNPRFREEHSDEDD